MSKLSMITGDWPTLYMSIEYSDALVLVRNSASTSSLSGVELSLKQSFGFALRMALTSFSPQPMITPRIVKKPPKITGITESPMIITYVYTAPDEY